MRYFRAYPWSAQLFCFAFLWFGLFLGAAGIIPPVILKLTGYSYTDMADITPDSPAGLIQAALVAQGLSSLFIFFLPAFLFAYLAHPSPSEYLGLRPPGKKIHWLLVALVIIGAIPVLELIDGLMSFINFGPNVKALQDKNDNTVKAFFKMPTVMSFIRTFVVMAMVPAIGEEFFFRGIFMRFVKKQTRNMAIPILFSAMVFALVHANYYGLPSILMAGTLLAVIYYLTGSLWCSMFAHLLFNGLQIMLSFAGNFNSSIKAYVSDNSLSFAFTFGGLGAILFAVSFYYLLKNKTPLPPNWTDDFTPEELPGFDFGEKN